MKSNWLALTQTCKSQDGCRQEAVEIIPCQSQIHCHEEKRCNIRQCLLACLPGEQNVYQERAGKLHTQLAKLSNGIGDSSRHLIFD